MATFEIKHSRDSLGSEYPKHLVIGEADTLAEAVGILRRSGHGYIEHTPTGLSRHEIEHDGGPDIVWFDADGVQHPCPF